VHQVGDHASTRIQNVLAVVEDEQEMSVAEGVDQCAN
jgi:hypothetical protein